MPGLDPGISRRLENTEEISKNGMPGSSPGMTTEGWLRLRLTNSGRRGFWLSGAAEPAQWIGQAGCEAFELAARLLNPHHILDPACQESPRGGEAG